MLKRQPAFFEATFTTKHRPSLEGGAWKNESSQDFFIFTSSSGTVKLRKREGYPATFMRSAGTKLVFGYGNEQLGHVAASQPLGNVPEEVFVQEEFLYGYADSEHQDVVIQRDAACVLPLFVREQDEAVVLSNRYDQLFNEVDRQQVGINEDALVNYLLFDDRHYQLAIGTDVLYDRVRFTLSKGVIQVLYPNDAAIATKNSRVEGHPRHFKDALEAVFDTYWERYGNVGFQVSGGLDSATAPGYFASQGKTVIAASFGLPAVMGELQRNKLADMERRFPLLNNFVIDLTPEEYFPFSDRIIAEHWGISHEHQDLHQQAAIRMAEYFSSQGITAMFTGVGGDELCQNITNDMIFPTSTKIVAARNSMPLPEYVTEKFRDLHKSLDRSNQQDRPVPATAYSVILTNIGFNNTFIDRNVWPVAPLADPKLFLYAQTIGVWHRHDKGLLRAYQFARQFPSSITHPETLEDFSEFLHLCKPQIGGLLDSFFDNSMLARRGLLHESSFKAYYRDCIDASYDASDTRILELIRLLTVEINLRAYQ